MKKKTSNNIAQINCFRASLEYRCGCRMLLQVHDELIFECPKETVVGVKAEIKEYMEHLFYIDIGTGKMSKSNRPIRLAEKETSSSDENQCPHCKGAGGFYSLAWDGKLECIKCWGSGKSEGRTRGSVDEKKA